MDIQERYSCSLPALPIFSLTQEEYRSVVVPAPTQADQILLRNGVMSADTMATRHDLDPEKERQLMGR